MGQRRAAKSQGLTPTVRLPDQRSRSRSRNDNGGTTIATYLVTGAAGFIGWKTAEHLLEEGHRVLGTDNLHPFNDPRLKRWRLEQLQEAEAYGERFTFEKGDVTEEHHVEHVTTGHEVLENEPPEAIFHLAARAGVRASTQTPEEYLDTNGQGTLALLEACRHNDIPRLILASTSSLYGDHNEVPFSEDQPTERPPSPYAASKKAAEAMAATYNELYGIHTPVFRYFTVYGPAGRTDMAMLRFVRWVVEGEPITIYGDGTRSETSPT